MTRIGAIRFTVTQSCKAASDFLAARRFGGKHTSTYIVVKCAQTSVFTGSTI
jgi:hypothetical protein